MLLLGLLLRDFDLAAFSDLLSRVPAWFYLASFAVLAGGQLLYTFKWQLVLLAMGHRVAFWRLVEQYLIGIFFNNFLPTGIGGDVARVYYLGRREGFATVATSVVGDRALGLVSITLWATVLLWWLDLPGPAFAVARHVLTVLLVGVAAALVVLTSGAVDALAPRLRALPGLVWGGRILEVAREATHRFRRQPHLSIGVLVIVLVYFLGLASMYRVYFRLAASREVPLLPIVAALLAIAVLANIPVTVNGIGLREQLHWLLFGGLGLPKELAVAASLLVFSQFLLLSLVGCLLWMRLRVSACAAP